MTKNLKISLALVALAALAIVAVALSSDDEPTATAEPSAAGQSEFLVRADSPRLSSGTKATFVEFLDFECEACGALYPTIEELKDTYGDDVAFVVRYMPLHTSSVNAAKAAEAAGAQDKFKVMYDILFQRQVDWGHQEVAEEQKFFDYAEEIGLDMTQFETDFNSAEIADRIAQSEADGRALGVQGTPTMFLDGTKLEPRSYEDFTSAFEAAVAD